MPERRRIVPDNSVLVPGFFREALPYAGHVLDLTARAVPLVDAIRAGRVWAVAPDALLQEFLAVAYRKARPRDGAAVISTDELQAIYLDFVTLPI